MVKFQNNTEGVVLNSIVQGSQNQMVLKKFITTGYYSDTTIVIGELLKNKLNISLNDDIFLLTFENNTLDEINTIKVSGFFKTNISDYDRHMIFTNNSLFNDKNIYSYFRLDGEIKTDYILNSNYNFLDTYDLNRSFFSWLSGYDNPIKVLVIFLFLISLINIINNNYYLVYQQREQVKILLILGLHEKQLKNIIILRSVILSIFSSMVGLIVAYSLLILESSNHFIKVPQHVYFIEFIPISIQYNFAFIILFYIISISLFSTLFNFNISEKK